MRGTDYLQRVAAAIRPASAAEPSADADDIASTPALPVNAPTIESLNKKRGSSWFMMAVAIVAVAAAAAFLVSPDLNTIISKLKGKPDNVARQDSSAPSSPTTVKVTVDETPPPVETPSTAAGSSAKDKPIELVPTVTGGPNVGTRPPQPATAGASVPAIAASKPASETKPEPDIRYVGSGYIDTNRITEAEGARDARVIRASPSTSASGIDPDARVAVSNVTREDKPDTLGSRLANGTRYTTSAGVSLNDRRNLILAGSVIDCTLDDAIDSSLPGLVSCTVARDVWSDDGSCKLIPKGSRGVGEYAGRQEQGQQRIFVIWNQIQASGITIDLTSPGTDSLGRSGVAGNYDSRFWERFRGALILSMVSGVSNRGGNSGSNVLAPAVQAGANTALEMDMKIPPVVTLDQGSKIMIKVARHLRIAGRCEG